MGLAHLTKASTLKICNIFMLKASLCFIDDSMVESLTFNNIRDWNFFRSNINSNYAFLYVLSKHIE